MSYSNWLAVCDMRSAVIITLGGEHDLATEAPLRDAVTRHARCGGGLVVDLSPATFCDGTVAKLLQYAHANSSATTIVAPRGGQPRRLIEASGMSATMTVCETVDQALPEIMLEPTS